MLKKLTKNLLSSFSKSYQIKTLANLLNKNTFSRMCTSVKEPESLKTDSLPNDYKLLYVENIPHDWNEEDIKTRFEQIGVVESVHIIKNTLGESAGKIVVQFEKIENIVSAIEKFKNKSPDLKPIKMKFFRKFGESKEKSVLMKNVLLVKNLPYDVTPEDIQLILESIAVPIHVALPRNE